VDGVRLIGTARRKASILSFVMEGIHPHDIGTIVDREGVAIRTGHHCAQPVMDRFGIPATARASLAMYNTRDDVDAFVRRWSASGRSSRERSPRGSQETKRSGDALGFLGRSASVASGFSRTHDRKSLILLS
jgi:cysteine sulfinate desulfinase/cysteine desulfurase-like protein